MDDNAAAKANTTAAGTQHGVSKDGDARHGLYHLRDARVLRQVVRSTLPSGRRIPIAQPGACPALRDPNKGRPSAAAPRGRWRRKCSFGACCEQPRYECGTQRVGRPSPSEKISFGSEPPVFGSMAGRKPVVSLWTRLPISPKDGRDRAGWREKSRPGPWRSGPSETVAVEMAP